MIHDVTAIVKKKKGLSLITFGRNSSIVGGLGWLSESGARKFAKVGYKYEEL